MPKAFNLKSRKKPGTCAAMRCKEEATAVGPNGMELCPRHADMLVAADFEEPQNIETPDVDALAVATEVSPEQEYASDSLAQLQEVTIEDDDVNNLAVGLVKEVKVKLKRLEQKRKEVLAPIKESQKRVQELFNPGINALKELETLLKGKMTDYVHLQRKRRTEALKSGDKEALATTAPTDAPEGVSFRKVWKWRVTDALSVPRQYLRVDETAVGHTVTAKKGETDIPGIEVFCEDSVAVRT